jgi:hypothetical protein
MTVGDVESILGAGHERTEDFVPTIPPFGPAIKGERFYEWQGEAGSEIWVGVRDGRICDKWYYEPSL